MPLHAADGLQPQWDSPAGAWMSTRAGGVSQGPYASLNLGQAVGDEPAAVAENRRRVAECTGQALVWLRQVHGCRVVRVGAADSLPGAPLHEADAAWTDQPGVAIGIQVADCLPVLLASPDGRVVAGAHAGWRGLAGGVLANTVHAVCDAAACSPAQLQAWLGPCIGPQQFEVGADVLQAFGADPAKPASTRFVARARADGSAAWLADLAGLARDQLQAAGLARISGGEWCTVTQASRFFSFRRDRPSGRLAAVVWPARR